MDNEAAWGTSCTVSLDHVGGLTECDLRQGHDGRHRGLCLRCGYYLLWGETQEAWVDRGERYGLISEPLPTSV